MDTTAIWTVFHQKMLRYLEKRTACRADAEDLLQEVFVKIHLKLPTLANGDSLPFWVWRLTQNTLLDYRKKRRLPTTELGDANGAAADGDEADFRNYVVECVGPFLELLPSDRREAIELGDFQRLPQRELADRWGIGLSGAKSRVQRARAELRQKFDECCVFETDRRGGVVDFRRRPNPSAEIAAVREKIAERLKKTSAGCVFPCDPRLSC